MYLNLVQLAESFGVPERVVEGWVRHEGLPHTSDRGRLLFDRTQVAEWASARGLAARAGFLAAETPALSAGWELEPLLRVGGIWREVPSAEVTGTFKRIVERLPAATPPIRALLAQRLAAPGGVTWAPIGAGFALPHPSARVALGRDSGLVALLLLKDPLPMQEPVPDAEPVTRLFFFIAPSPRVHLDLLARLTRQIARGPLREAVSRTAPDEEILLAAAPSAAAPGREPGA